MYEAIFKYSFMQNALAASVMASIACGIIGTMIVEKKLVMMSGGIAHTAFGGVGMGYYFKIEPIIGALLFSLLASCGIAKIYREINTHTDILMGLFWSLGMAAGILFIAFTPGYPPDISSYLFGDILTLTRSDLAVMALLDIFVLAVVAVLFDALKAYLFDEELLMVKGISIRFFDYLLFAMIAATIVLLIRVAGIILVIALLTAPVAIAKIFARDLKPIMIIASLLGALFCVMGLWVSYELRIASGATIVMMCGVSYIAAALFRTRLGDKVEKKEAQLEGMRNE